MERRVCSSLDGSRISALPHSSSSRERLRISTPKRSDDDHRSRLVCVTYDLDPAIVRRLFDAFLGVPRTDTPDRAALTDNPLSIGRLV